MAETEKKYSINILLSTYNGEKYVKKQIESILDQEGCDVFLTIRDDGSYDSTVQIIEELISCYPDRIKLYKEENVGYRESFLHLVSIAEETDYYGFADQDDYWEKDKCLVGIKKIEQIKNKSSVALYVSPVIICNENLEIIGYNDIESPNRLESYFIRHRISGCTMIFTNSLRKIVKEFYDQGGITNKFIDHDLVVGSMAYCYGTVIRDTESYMLHRRSSSSVTSGGRGLMNRIKTESFILLKRKNCHFDLSNSILNFSDQNKNMFGEIQNRRFLEKVSVYKSRITNTFRLLFDKKFDCGIFVCNLETKLKVLMRNF